MECNILACRLSDDARGDEMRLAERHLVRAHQPIGKVGRGRIACPGSLADARDVYVEAPGAVTRSWSVSRGEVPAALRSLLRPKSERAFSIYT